MKALIECLIEWLDEERSDSNALRILKKMATATLTKVDFLDEKTREMDVLDVVNMCESGRNMSYEQAKRWFAAAKPTQYLEGRRADIESHFLKQGHTQTLELIKRTTTGHHRAAWFFSPYDLENKLSQIEVSTDSPESVGLGTGTGVVDAVSITYEVTQTGDIKLNWIGRLLLGSGAIVTRSGRGLVWAALFLLVIGLILSCGYLFLEMRKVHRPLQTGDLVLLLSLATSGWVFWRLVIRPFSWLLEDRIVLTGDLFAAIKEDPVQIDMAKDEKHRYIRLVRYTAVCPVCAGRMELRYGYGTNFRRVFGCCTEVPAEHVFTFDRVTRQGQRYKQ